MKKTIFILGSTGVGKSHLALKISKQLNISDTSTAIVNADSLQFYKNLNIGTAKPTQEEMLSVPHLLFDCLNYPKEATVAWYYNHFFSNIEQHNYKNFFIVGGSGFYIRALESGLYPNYEVSSLIKNKYETMGKEKGALHLHKILKEIDAKSADAIHGQDTYRLVRALSVIEASGKSLSEIKAQFAIEKKEFPYPFKKIALFVEREELKKIVLKRIQFMLKSGFIEEVEDILKKGQAHWKPLSSIGYKEVQMYLRGDLDKKGLEDLILRSTMALAKRQRTWFKKDKDIQWFHAINEIKQAEKSICIFLQKG
ncbi:MAG: tRNA (adenosine(37)-N6)-dimethylallyltransferase MiaA [Bdellovibrionaceae bacterium]|nr:tRNA (adenosine(37)-N6)-dimethylallyltransferase MiaA [Pseudobdellovibrionaceae bacterium]